MVKIKLAFSLIKIFSSKATATAKNQRTVQRYNVLWSNCDYVNFCVGGYGKWEKPDSEFYLVVRTIPDIMNDMKTKYLFWTEQLGVECLCSTTRGADRPAILVNMMCWLCHLSCVDSEQFGISTSWSVWGWLQVPYTVTLRVARTWLKWHRRST